MQRVCGTKQIREILASSGRFDPDTLREALRRPAAQDGDAEEDAEEDARDAADQEQRHRLLHEKAEAKAR